jgi:hypothetical protein
MAQEQEEKIFADGFIFKRNEKAPEFVIGRISIKVEDAVAFLKQHQDNGWVNLGVKQARSGNYYIELDTFKPGNDSAVDKYEAKKQPAPAEEEPVSDLPF